MEARTIIASNVKSSRSNNMVWAVQITGIQGTFAYCKSAMSAMKFMFLLKVRTGFNISENILARLSYDIKSERLAKAKAIQEQLIEVAIAHSVDNTIGEKAEPKPKAKRRTRRTSKKAAASV